MIAVLRITTRRLIRLNYPLPNRPFFKSRVFWDLCCQGKEMSSTNNGANTQEQAIGKDEMHNFIERCMTKVGAKNEHAQVLADLLVAADYRGHYSHGLNRLDMYVRDVQTGITASDKEPEVVKETVATALVNGNNLLGPVVGRMCMDMAIQKAKSVGIGMVVANASNHFGIAGWYAIRAMEQGLIGMAFTNTSPLMVPTRATKATLGTNPISCAAPAQNGDSFVLDMATTAVALGKLELNARKGVDIPLGWGCDENGKATVDPNKASGLMPLGGTEECSGYKGYGLAAMVEILCGILAGSHYGPNVRKWKTTETEADLGQCFLAINPSMFADGFTDRMSDLNSTLRNLPSVDGEGDVLVPGDPELSHQKICDKRGGIPYHANQVKFAVLRNIPKTLTNSAKLMNKSQEVDEVEKNVARDKELRVLMDLASKLSIDPPKILS